MIYVEARPEATAGSINFCWLLSAGKQWQNHNNTARREDCGSGGMYLLYHNSSCRHHHHEHHHCESISRP